ncbi:imidazoleglycerol-phosphate dehydratase HisB [Liberiplasma polymorphum]|uniref:imidazoleglycerol-phosphate dehydratase HisB n=1 Tax=Liberiplasma polymorphum TaxID=3374570 RepID=UPI0037768FCE
MNRTGRITRKTNETNITVELTIDGTKEIKIDTGIGFLDHMLTLFAFQAGFDLTVKAEGDLYIDDHHTTEDIGISLGQAFNQAMEEKLGINRYGVTYLPMDEALSRVVIDISNRPYLVYNVFLEREKLGQLNTQNVKEFFKAFVQESRINLHIENLYGENDHHKVESIFKAFGRALKDACKVVSDEVPSTKGVL